MVTLEEIKELQEKYAKLFFDLEFKKSEYNTEREKIWVNNHKLLCGFGVIEGKIFEIDVKMIQLLELTDNEPHLTKLPFPMIFIPNTFNYLGTVMHGIIMTELPDVLKELNKFRSKYPNTRKEDEDFYYLDKNGERKNHLINVFTLSESSTGRTLISTTIDESISEVAVIKQEGCTVKDERLKELNTQMKNLQTFCLNLLDFIHDPEITWVQKKFTKYEIKKVYGHNQVPTVRKIIIHGKLKRYIRQLVAGNAFSYSHRFWVRGHFRHFKSSYYKESFGKTIWIKPFIKGEGILIEKQYHVQEN